jgi:hypothetical protein
MNSGKFVEKTIFGCVLCACHEVTVVHIILKHDLGNWFLAAPMKRKRTEQDGNPLYSPGAQWIE